MVWSRVSDQHRIFLSLAVGSQHLGRRAGVGSPLLTVLDALEVAGMS